MAARDDTPSIREITELTARLRRLSSAGRDADPAERVAFLADKDALIARIESANRQAKTGGDDRSAAAAAVAEAHDEVTSLVAPEIERTADGTADDDAADDEDGWSR